ncbi:MAG TPA: pyridoxamine 5'-phosphate oxidase [Gaiellaceae bacterium]|nr:pyridoxamine 5'-phosphate oxidase [Gaiellaceae bacterium]
MTLRRADLDPDPLGQFRGWLAEAGDAVPVPEAVAVATASARGEPSVRMVLLKAADERGLVFYTHTTSRKGRELAENPRAALLFHWWQLGRQVRVEGAVEPVAAAEADAYFASRPRPARVGALASRQSEPLVSRAELEARVAEVERRLDGADPPRPETWGGYRVVPAAWEFWQHRDDRLHDRFRYERDAAGAWAIARLYP